MSQELTGCPTEITISIKTEDATYKKKFLLYETYHLDAFDPVIDRCIKEALAELKGEYSEGELDIKIRAMLQV